MFLVQVRTVVQAVQAVQRNHCFPGPWTGLAWTATGPDLSWTGPRSSPSPDCSPSGPGPDNGNYNKEYS